MADGRSKLKDLANAFEKRHEILRCRLSQLGFESEGTNGDQNFDSSAPEGQEKHKRLVRTNIAVLAVFKMLLCIYNYEGGIRVT